MVNMQIHEIRVQQVLEELNESTFIMLGHNNLVRLVALVVGASPGLGILVVPTRTAAYFLGQL